MERVQETIASRVSLLIEDVPEVEVLHQEVDYVTREQGVFFTYSGAEYILTYLEDYKRQGKPALVLDSYHSYDVPDNIVEHLDDKLSRESEEDQPFGKVWHLENQEDLPDLGQPISLSHFLLYSELWQEVHEDVEDRTKLRFTEEQLYRAFNRQGILRRDYDLAIDTAEMMNILNVRDDGIAVTRNGLTEYEKMLR